jgi:hypothetical protein
MKPCSFSRKHQRGAASTWVFAGFALVALFFLLTEHRAHLYGWLPFILLAACPLMHLFHGGHGGHGGHGRHGGHGADEEPRRRDETLPPSTPSNPDAPVPPVAHHHH